MAFRKRNIALSRAPADGDASPSTPSPPVAAPAPTPVGVRPSPIDGRPTTSTGTPSLDGILAGHAGLPLGNSILIEESGTTDYAGALLRFYAAEGVVQGHKVHVVGMGEVWGRELPGISEDRGDEKRRENKERAEKMKIAWRYEGLGQFESARGACCVFNSMQCCLFAGLTTSDRSAEGANTGRERRGSHLLPYVRSCETTHAACGHSCELHCNPSNGSVHVAVHVDIAERTASACFNAEPHHPPSRHTISSFTSMVSSNVFASELNPPIPARPACVIATIPHKTHGCHHSAAIPIPPLIRPGALDGDSLGWCP